jgi:hypothetical protein
MSSAIDFANVYSLVPLLTQFRALTLFGSSEINRNEEGRLEIRNIGEKHQKKVCRSHSSGFLHTFDSIGFNEEI